MKLNTATATSASSGPETSALMCNRFWMQIRTQFLPNEEKMAFLVSGVGIEIYSITTLSLSSPRFSKLL